MYCKLIKKNQTKQPKKPPKPHETGTEEEIVSESLLGRNMRKQARKASTEQN